MPRWVHVATALAILASLYSLAFRYRVEQRNRAVELVAEAETVQDLAASSSDLPFPDALAELKSKGLRGVVLSEQTVSDLLNAGALSMLSTDSGPLAVTFSAPPKTLDRIERGVRIRFGDRAPLRPAADTLIVRGVAASTIRGLAVGLSPEAAADVRGAGLDVVARASNPVGVDAEGVKSTIRWMGEMGARALLPQGDQVLGRRDNLPALQEALDEVGMLYCSPEFVKIGGDANVVAAAPENVVRLHSAQVAELDKLPLSEAVDRYSRAARERNMRMLLLRPLNYSSDVPVRSFAQFVSAVASDIGRQGGGIGMARPFEEPGVPTPVFVLIALPAAAVAMWAGSLFVSDRRLRIGGCVLLALLALACWSQAARPWMALVAAVAFPVAAYGAFLGRAGGRWPVELAAISVTSLAGGLCVSGLLNALPYLVVAKQFPGVKAAHFLPIALVGWMLFRTVADPKGALGSTVRWGQALLAILALGALALMFARTGNDNPAAVSGLEVKFRSLLDSLLFVRPRTKEFLIGHPLLAIGLALWIRERAAERKGAAAGWAAVAMTAGAIGQTSIVNTLCHLHTPLSIGLARLGVGLLAGGIIGAILWALTARLLPRSRS